jgi:hypothetical protein
MIFKYLFWQLEIFQVFIIQDTNYEIKLILQKLKLFEFL